MIARVRLLLIAACVALLAAACQVGVDVEIRVAEDGSGIVAVGLSFDEEAQDELQGDLGDALVVDDMEEAGWVVTGPEVEDDGLMWIRASKPFNAPEELTPIMEEIAGPDGAFRDFVLLREKGFAELDYTLTGLVDLTTGPTAFSDAGVAEVLGDNDVDSRIADLEEEYGPAADNVSVTVKVDLPGGAQGDAAEGGGAVWVVSFSDPEPTQVAASASDENVSAKLWRWIGIAALILFAIAAVIQLVSWLLERRAKKRAPAMGPPQQVGSAVPLAARGQMPAHAPPPVAAPPPQAPARKLRLVVLDPAGVAFDLADDPSQRLLPFVRGRGSEVPDAEVVEVYREASLGRLSSAELWSTCGLAEPADQLDAEYMSTVSMRSGAAEFLAEMDRRGMAVAFLGNTLAEWSRILRGRAGLDTVTAWVISAEVGVRNPDPGILEALRRETGVPYEDCLMVDGRPINLDAARTLGMSTAWFTDTHPSPDNPPSHPVVTNFSEFFRRR